MESLYTYINRDTAKIINNICHQILLIETPQDRLRAAISSVMILNSLLDGYSDLAKTSVNHLRHLCNILMKDVSSVEHLSQMSRSGSDSALDSDEDIYVDTSNANYPMSEGEDRNREEDEESNKGKEEIEDEESESEEEEESEGEDEHIREL